MRHVYVSLRLIDVNIGVNYVYECVFFEQESVVASWNVWFKFVGLSITSLGSIEISSLTGVPDSTLIDCGYESFATDFW